MGVLVMRRTALRLLAALAVAAGAWPLLWPSRVEAAGQVTLVVIVASTSKLTNISLEDLRHTFTGDRSVDTNGSKVIPLNQPPRTPDRAGFDRAVLELSPDEVARFWIDRKIRGGNRPPRAVADTALLRTLVEKLPGAISYVQAKDVSPQVRVVTVNGKLPQHPAYPLRY